jgi:hypothetical protein
VLAHVPAEARTAYNRLVAAQNDEWTRFMPSVALIPWVAPAVTETAYAMEST